MIHQKERRQSHLPGVATVGALDRNKKNEEMLDDMLDGNRHLSPRTDDVSGCVEALHDAVPRRSRGSRIWLALGITPGLWDDSDNYTFLSAAHCCSSCTIYAIALYHYLILTQCGPNVPCFDTVELIPQIYSTPTVLDLIEDQPETLSTGI
jgi:hypothetical protein